MSDIQRRAPDVLCLQPVNEVRSFSNDVRNGEHPKHGDNESNSHKVANHEHLSSGFPVREQLCELLMLLHPDTVRPPNEREDECAHTYLHIQTPTSQICCFTRQISGGRLRRMWAVLVLVTGDVPDG